MNPMRTIAVAALLVATAACSAAAQGEDTFRWSGELAAGKMLDVQGLNGDVHARPASGRTVEIVAVKRGDDDDPREVRVEVNETAEGIQVCAVYPGGRDRSYSTCDDSGHDDHDWDDNDVTVDFTVSVPSGVRFDGSTVNGGIEAMGLSATEVSVSTVNGGIDVSSTGSVEAQTVNGSIRASTGASSWSGTLDFETVNGSITLTLPAGVGAAVSAETVNGDIESDFPLTIEAGEWGPQSVNGTIGGGGGRLNLETVNGEIVLRKS
jgi:hypothetical protein